MEFIGKLLYYFKKTRLTYWLALSFFACVCVTGCKNDDSGADNNGVVNESGNKDENECNPLGLPNYVYYSDKSKTNKYNDVSVIALLGENYKNDEYISCGSILGVKDNNAVFTYNINSYSLKSEDELKEAEQSEYESKYNYLEKQHLLAVNTQDMTVIKDIEMGRDCVAYPYDSYFYVFSRDNENHKTSVMLYDYNLDVVYEHEFNNFITLYFDSNLKNGYYVEDSKLKCICVDDNSIKEIATTDYLEFNYICGVITSTDGKVYITANANAINMNAYSVIIDVATGDSVKEMDDSELSINSETNDKLVLQKYEEDGQITYIYLPDCKNGKAYSVSGNTLVTGFNILPDGKIVIEKCNNNTIELYEYEGGELLASTDVVFDESLTDDYSKFTDCKPQIFKDAEEEFEYEGGEEYYGASLVTRPVQLNDGSILFEVCTYDCCYYVRWQPDKDNLGEEAATISEFSIDSISNPEIVVKVDVSKYVPGELSSELKELRDKADNLEKEYSVEILIGEECRNILHGYAIDPLTDYNDVEIALGELESQLKRYPKGFFEQFITDYTKGLKIYLTSDLTGHSDDELENPSGFQILIDGYNVIVIDATHGDEIVRGFNHELAHAIDDFILEKNMYSADYCLSDENWEKLNPQIGNTVYTFDYVEQGYEEDYVDYLKYAYEFEYEENENTYFVSYYGMTNPGEDRAELMEEVMSGKYEVDFDKAPHLKNKLNYFCKCIRETFDTTGWGKQPWEKYYN